MCGILGILAAQPPSKAELLSLAGLLRHRGPDDAGVFVGEGVGLAATRLSIIDIAGGHQPLGNEDGTVWITFNGEIFNAAVLREELAAAGHRFRTRSDTETIVHGYEEWGEAVAERLRGMFAFGLWDVRRRRLLLARDRFGIKPLHYAWSGSSFAFASEIRPLLAALPDLPRRGSREFLWRLLELGFAPPIQTAFEGVHRLLPAHTATIENGELRTRRYWTIERPRAGEHETLPPGVAVDRFMELLQDAVKAWRLSDVPVASTLSGGVDSGGLTALLCGMAEGPVHTFSIGFTKRSHDESDLARETARCLASTHHETTFSMESFDRLPDAVRHLEQPQVHLICVPVYLIYEMCHEAGFKVVMAGEGADELLGGYPWYGADRRLSKLGVVPRFLRRGLASTLHNVPAKIRELIAEATAEPLERYLLWHRVSAEDQRERLLGARYAPATDALREAYGEELAGRHPMDQILTAERHLRLSSVIVANLDRMSMAHSVEARVPFLDHPLWEFCARLPPDQKLTPTEDKRLLRQGMIGRLPDPVRLRRKKGLASPDHAWCRSGRLPDWAEDLLTPAALASAGYFHPSEVTRVRERLFDRHGSATPLWSAILTTQIWHHEVLARSF